jgi:malate synthase
VKVAHELEHFVEQELLSGIEMSPADFWNGFAALVREHRPTNRELLQRRDELQAQIDEWHRANPVVDSGTYRRFLVETGYLVDDPAPFEIDTSGMDPEITRVAGPQLVVPVSNARYALNAANARWGSLYDAVYGTDVLGSGPPIGPYDPARGAEVVAWVRGFLDRALPLARGSHRDATEYFVDADGAAVRLRDGSVTRLAQPDALVGITGPPAQPERLLFEHHGLGIDLHVDRADPVGAADAAGIAGVELEAALTVVADLEDSVAAVDAADKVAVYRNWLGLLRGDLTADVESGSGVRTRRLAADRHYTTPQGAPVTKRGRAVLLARNVGLLMTTDAVLDGDGSEVPEGLLDLYVTVACGLHDRRRGVAERNSATGAIYVVKPKLHGPDEAAFTDATCAAVESTFGLPVNTIKIGLMDEERRTSTNLASCIHALRHRIFFVNTGFLDRTGDEIHTSFDAGPMVRKADMKRARWIDAYEESNLEIALRSGFLGRAQIGKGMWAAPDLMRDMLEAKVAHPAVGASCAWVPSPTAATLHATHYHDVDVAAVQRRRLGGPPVDRDALLADLLTPPVEPAPAWTQEEVLEELHDNLQSILGYVVRWVELGIGCSKIPNLAGVALMEDRATCRISSQLLANWLHHGVVTLDQVEAGLRRMAVVVDRQNESAEESTTMGPGFDGAAFGAARDLVVDGKHHPSGYTEPTLHAARRAQRQVKAAS